MTNAELSEMNKGRCINQICYVTDDYRRTITFLYEKLDFGPWKVLEFSEQNTQNIRLYGVLQDEPFAFMVALCKIGEVQIEVIQPIRGNTIYDRYLKERGCGIHHIKEKKPRPEAETLLAEWQQNGLEEAFYGDGFMGIGDRDSFWYLDTYEALGAYYEIGNCPPVVLPEEAYFVWP